MRREGVEQGRNLNKCLSPIFARSSPHIRWRLYFDVHQILFVSKRGKEGKRDRKINGRRERREGRRKTMSVVHTDWLVAFVSSA